MATSVLAGITDSYIPTVINFMLPAQLDFIISFFV